MLADGGRSKNNAPLENHAGSTNQSLIWSNCAQVMEESTRLAETVRDIGGRLVAVTWLVSAVPPLGDWKVPLYVVNLTKQPQRAAPCQTGFCHEGIWSEHADGNPATCSSCSPSRAPCGRRTWSCTIEARTDCSRRGHARRTGCALRRSGLIAPCGPPISGSCGTPISGRCGPRSRHGSAPHSGTPYESVGAKSRWPRVSW